MIECKGLVKTYGLQKALQGIDLDAHPGEIVGLLGTNGAGKTTTLRVLSTLARPTAGQVRVAGFDVAANPQEVRRSIGVVTSDDGLYGRLTPDETLRLSAQLRGLPSRIAAERAETLLQWLDLIGARHQLVETFSKGMRQKLNIARALLHDPGVLLFDEPTSGLDPISSRTVLHFLRDQKAAGKTVLFSTHVIHEAEALCDRVVVIHLGRVLANDCPGAILAQAETTSLEEAYFHLIGEAL